MATPNSKRMYGAAFIGCGVKRTIARTTTYRLRRGNGQYGAKLGVLYQDKFARVVPGSINNTNGEPYRAMLRAAVVHWQKKLSTAEKVGYNRLAGHIQHLSGYNLFLSRAIKGEIEMYVDRGDPATHDFAVGNFITDWTWRELDLSTIVPAGAKAVNMVVGINANALQSKFLLRKNGNSNFVVKMALETIVADANMNKLGVVACDANRKLQYRAQNIAWTLLNVSVCGWWT